MSRRGAEPSPRRGAAIPTALAALGLLVALAAGAVEAPPDPAELELTPSVRQELARLQESWLDWLAAVYQEDESATSLALAEMQSGAARVGLRRLPDLSLGAAVQAIRVAREGQPKQAGLALAAAERLDPGLAEPEFARGALARLEGGRGLAGLAAVRHLAGSALLTRLGLANLSLWLLATLVAAGVAYVAVLMATRGRRLVERLSGWLQPQMPAPVAYALTLALLVWPLVLPGGPMALVVYWAILLWGHGDRFERLILAGLLLLLGLSPLLVNEERKRLGVDLSPPARAIENVRSGRLGGTLFSDLGLLRAILPDSPPVRHLLGDVHVMLGQWPLARDLYLQVLDAEPDNTAARVDAGVCLFHLRDFEKAIEHFNLAASLDGTHAAARFNLSQTYSELLRFDESARALRAAQSLEPQSVGRWIREAAESRVIPVRGGLERTGEIRGQIAAAWRSGEVTPSWYLSLPPAVLFVAIAVVLHLLLPVGKSTVRPSDGDERRSLGVWARTLLPGYAEFEAGRRGAALGALIVPAALLMLPLAARSGFRLPWLLAPSAALAWWVSGIGLLLWVLTRYLRQWRRT